MQVTFPDTKAESWADRPIRATVQPTGATERPLCATAQPFHIPNPAIVATAQSLGNLELTISAPARPIGAGVPLALSEPDYDYVPEFALLETGGPHPVALLLSLCCLGTLLGMAIILTSLQRLNIAPRENFTELVAPPEALSAPDPSAPQIPPASSTPVSQTAQPTQPDPSPSNPVMAQPLRPEPLRPEPLAADPVAADAHAGEALPRELMESPPAATVSGAAADAAVSNVAPKPALATVPKDVPKTVPAGVLAAAEIPKASSTGLPLSPTDVASSPTKTASVTAGLNQIEVRESRNAAPITLGALPLAQLLNQEAMLAARLLALPSATRVALPRVSIRVNTEWFAALPQTQEKLYFSYTTPQAETEALAYSPATQSFTLAIPMRPLWQIRQAGKVPALAALRAQAARRLGVPTEAVGIYTWHPPVLENALSMFVLERMHKMRVQLGPSDTVTVRLASGAGGAVMNLEPIRAGVSR